MKIWQIEIGTEELGPNVDVVNGLAESPQQAISRAIAVAENEKDYKKPYPSKVTEIGDVDF